MKKQITRNRIGQAAIGVFSKSSYEEVTLSQITSAADVSNSLIYNYFKNKEEIFCFLLLETCKRIETAFEVIEGKTLEERVKNFIEINLKLAKKEFELVRIYREGQYKFVKYEKKLKKIYIDALERIFQKDISEGEYLYIMSGIRYINVKYACNLLEVDLDFMTEIILNGFSHYVEFDFKNFKRRPLYEIAPFNCENTKIKLLKTGEELFGTYGYHNVKISDIGEKLDMAVGSFYKYFPNKETFLKILTEKIRDSALFFIKYNSEEGVTSLEKQLEFLYLMAIFFQKSPYRYQIIRESEYVSSQISQKYFETLENYMFDTFAGTEYSKKEKNILSCYLIGISHYIGIELFFTKKINNLDHIVKELNYFFAYGCLVVEKKL